LATVNLHERFFNRPTAGDLLGGLAASTVLLPQAIAFGVTLLSPNGFSASQGAMAGLLGAAIVCLVSGFSGATKGLISSPTGPVMVLLAGVMTAFVHSGITGEALLTNLVAVVLFTGLFQILIGVSGGGKLIKYIPFPVISGFLTGSAILMLKSQIGPISGSGYDAAWVDWRWLPLVTVIVTFAAMQLIPKMIRQLPGAIAGLLIGTLVFHLLASMNDATIPSLWLIGQLPGLETASLNFSSSMLEQLDWAIIMPGAIALSILASLDTLMNSVIADVNTGSRHNARLELVSQGIGQMLTAVGGGMAVSGTTAATMVAIRSGGRRWAAVAAGLTLFILILFARDAGTLLPISVLAGIILSVSLHMIDVDILTWLKQPGTRQDAIIAILVTLVTVIYDLIAAVGLGVVIAIILFIRTQIRMNIVQRRSTRKQVRSVVTRSMEERELLEQQGDRIILYELRGNLFFATADNLLENLAGDLDGPNYVILHLRRVFQIDLTATRYLHQIAMRLHRHGGQLLLCNVDAQINIGHKMDKAMERVSPAQNGHEIIRFNGKDEALEYAENALLFDAGLKPTEFVEYRPLAENDLCQDLDEAEQADLQRVLQPRILDAGEILFSAGEPGDQLYLVLSGGIDIRLPTSNDRYKRLATCQPGTFLGELALLNPGPRVADAVANHRSEVLVLTREALDSLRVSHPDTEIHLLITLARIQVEHLRWSSAEIRHLSDW
jgi:SulP family sulfate permease